MRQMKACELVLDYDLYPRNSIDAHNVSNLKEALLAGAEIPAVIIDKKSKRVVDGFHRVKAHLQAYGEDASLDVIEKTYRSDSELFLDAMRYNSSHGAKLDSHDRTRCVLIAERLTISKDDIAGALHMTVDRLATLRVDRTATFGKLTIPLKRTLRHMHGSKLTSRQVEGNKKLSGMNQQFYVNQVIELIEADLLDESDSKLFERLIVLYSLLGPIVKKSKTA